MLAKQGFIKYIIQIMNELELLIDLHKDNDRQGPGSDTETRKALMLAGLDHSASLKIADIGCGTGSASLLLADLLPNADITAVDFLPGFLDVLRMRAEQRGLSNRIHPAAHSMDDLPFEEAQFDLIWSEGAIYNMGFEEGIQYWSRFLKPGGILAVSEITWLTDSRPTELKEHWQKEYPEIDPASAKMKILEKHGCSPVGYFVLPENCWIEHYYTPLQNRFKKFLADHNHSDKAQEIITNEEFEIGLYKKYKAFYSYGFYIAEKI